MLVLPAVSENADNFFKEEVHFVTKVIFLDGVFMV